MHMWSLGPVKGEDGEALHSLQKSRTDFLCEEKTQQELGVKSICMACATTWA